MYLIVDFVNTQGHWSFLRGTADRRQPHFAFVVFSGALHPNTLRQRRLCYTVTGSGLEALSWYFTYASWRDSTIVYYQFESK